MRIAIDAGPLYGHRTGVGVATAGMINALEPRSDVQLEPYLVSGRATPRPGHRRLPLPGLAASHLWSRSGWPSADRWIGDADLLHGTNYVAPPTSLPTVISVYDCWFLRHPERASPVVRRAGATLRRAVDRGAWIHTTSEATAGEVRSLLGTDRVATVLLGPPAEPARGTTSPSSLRDLVGRRFVVAVGTEERRKGLALLVDAFDRLAGDHDDLHLVLAGAAADDTEHVVARIGAARHRSRIRRLGPVDEFTKGWLLRHAAALAYPSLDEGFGFPVLEAQRVGVPVVATAVGSVPEIAGDGALLVGGRDPNDFAAALDESLGGLDRTRLIEAGMRNADRFSWDTTARGLVELYQRLTGP